jgi:hypothetical protein
MTTILNTLSCIMGKVSNGNYAPLPRDVSQAEKWVELHPFDSSLNTPLGLRKVENYAKSVVEDLGKVTISNNNISIIRDHLTSVGSQNYWVANQLFERIFKTTIDSEFKEKLLSCLADVINQIAIRENLSNGSENCHLKDLAHSDNPRH